MSEKEYNQETGQAEVAGVIQTHELEVSPKMGFVSVTVHAQSTAVSAGDYRVAIMQEVKRILSECHGHPVQATKVGLGRLRADGLIALQEQKTLGQICEVVFKAQRGEIKPEEAHAQVRTIYDQMLVDPSTSPVALAIASIASSGSVAEPLRGADVPEGSIARINREDKVGIATLAGAIAGAGIGAGIGGFGGAIIGGIVGGIAGGIGTACATA